MTTPSTSTAQQLGQRREALTLASPAREIYLAPREGERGITVTVRGYVGPRRLENRRDLSRLTSSTRPDLGVDGLSCRGTLILLSGKEQAAAGAWLDGFFGQAARA